MGMAALSLAGANETQKEQKLDSVSVKKLKKELTDQ